MKPVSKEFIHNLLWITLHCDSNRSVWRSQCKQWHRIPFIFFFFEIRWFDLKWLGWRQIQSVVSCDLQFCELIDLLEMPEISFVLRFRAQFSMSLASVDFWLACLVKCSFYRIFVSFRRLLCAIFYSSSNSFSFPFRIDRNKRNLLLLRSISIRMSNCPWWRFRVRNLFPCYLDFVQLPVNSFAFENVTKSNFILRYISTVNIERAYLKGKKRKIDILFSQFLHKIQLSMW